MFEVRALTLQPPTIYANMTANQKTTSIDSHMKNYNEYREAVSTDIKDVLKDMGCLPIIFAGAGLSRRYLDSPSWDQLLHQLCNDNPLLDKEYTYYRQAHNGDLLEVAEAFVRPYHEWAWGGGKAKFPAELFDGTVGKDAYIKHYVSALIRSIQPKSLSAPKLKPWRDEIKLLQEIRPNSIITTNYDQLTELVFPDYTPIVGQTIIKTPSAMIGEVFKIHGCVTSPEEIILTKSDYEGWNQKKKYLSAKLLTYFLEHPVLITGYSVQDPNVITILRDIDEILSSKGEIVENIYYVLYDEKLTDDSTPAREVILNLGEGSSMRVKAIYTKDLSWVFSAFAASEGIENVNPKLLRALMSRTYDLVRHDIPMSTLEVDYSTLEQAVQSDSALPKLLGITSVSDPEQFNAAYPYTLTHVGQKLGYSGWHGANQLMKQTVSETGIDIKTSDNQYHISVKSGENSIVHKYSDTLVSLLQKVKEGSDYELNLKKKKANKTPTKKV